MLPYPSTTGLNDYFHNFFLLPTARIGDGPMRSMFSDALLARFVGPLGLSPNPSTQTDREALRSSLCFRPFSMQVATSFISCLLLLSTGTIRWSPILLAPNTESKTLILDSYIWTPTSNSPTRARTTVSHLKRRARRRAALVPRTSWHRERGHRS